MYATSDKVYSSVTLVILVFFGVLISITYSSIYRFIEYNERCSDSRYAIATLTLPQIAPRGIVHCFISAVMIQVGLVWFDVKETVTRSSRLLASKHQKNVMMWKKIFISK